MAKKRKIISKKTADRMGSKVRHKAPSAPPAPTPEEKQERQHASMAASMADSAARHEATQQLIARNTEVVSEFAREVKELAAQPMPAAVEGPSEYVHPFAEGATFDVKRDKDKLLKRIHMRPGILED